MSARAGRKTAEQANTEAGGQHLTRSGDGERLLYADMSGPAMVAEDLEVGAGDRIVAKDVGMGPS